MSNKNRLNCIEDLRGRTLSDVTSTDDDEVIFTLFDGRKCKLYHRQDCCENVYVESIVGDLMDLVGTPILKAEQVSSEDYPPLSEYEESYTWSFYKLATIKGYVDIRFYGSSNGYYSESVDFKVIQDKLISKW